MVKNKRVSDLERMQRDEIRDHHLFLITDPCEKVSMSVTLGDLRDYVKYGQQERTGFKKRPYTPIFEEPPKESIYKRLKRLFFP